jgi:tRNA pseudouridine55 synthase
MLSKIKVGHAGTLDPLASGVIPLALGEATKVIPYLINADKEYIFEVTWGEQRSTDDSAGTILKSSSYRPSKTVINQALCSFRGNLDQLPPYYCAKKLNGKRAYDLARKGVDQVTLKPSAIEIKQLALMKSEENKATFHVLCSKGTYVRALARDLGQKLGCLGYASKIERTRVGSFTKESAISLEKLAESIKIGIVPALMQPLQAVLDDIPAVLINAQHAQKLRWGQAVVDLDAAMLSAESSHDVFICMKGTGEPVALGQFMNGELQPKRVFNL